MTGPELTVTRHQYPIRGEFRISRDAITEVTTLVATLRGATAVGRGACRPYSRYGESVGGVAETIQGQADAIAAGLDRHGLQAALGAGAARNALDAAFWDLAAKAAGKPAWRLAGLDAPGPLETAYTLSLDAPAAMQATAESVADRPLLKAKLGGGDGRDGQRIRAVRMGAPNARLIVDANEGWTPAETPDLLAAMAEAGVEMVEQPLPAGSDAVLAETRRPVTVCADESCHDRSSLPVLVGRYDMVNVKLDKTGGLTEALALIGEARQRGFQVMVGCMLASSLAMAPAFLAAGQADLVDLDGPLLLAQDDEPPLAAEGSLLYPPDPALWG